MSVLQNDPATGLCTQAATDTEKEDAAATVIPVGAAAISLSYFFLNLLF